MESAEEAENAIVYYGVHIPTDVQNAEGHSHILQNRVEALKVIKKHKKARFKAFSVYHKAVEFALHGYADATSNHVDVVRPEPVVGEKTPLFRAPKPQDLTALRKSIENGDLELVSTIVWTNPRYLISSGDTPSILQEGARYNALHVAAKSKNVHMCNLILSTVSNIDFVRLLYGDDTNQNSQERAQVFLDLYLNTPDKSLNETPLHFAAKFGAVEVVELLVMYKECDKRLVNKYGHTPNMMICERCTAPQAVKIKMAALLEETFYVPVLRAEDGCALPVIGEPFSPTAPLTLEWSPLGPKLEVHAYAGPMSKDEAVEFRKQWKTPPRARGRNASRLKDLNKGLEREGRELATNCQYEWKEYWPFLDCFANFATSDGLQLLESYLSDRTADEYVSEPSNHLDSPTSLETSQLVSPISEICKNLELCSLSDIGCRKVSLKSNYFAVTDKTREIVPDAKFYHSPFLCVERSCELFAHRICNDILGSLEPDCPGAIVMLSTQVKQLRLLMASFMSDPRFASVLFEVAHHRLGALISTKLLAILNDDDEYNLTKQTLVAWFEECGKSFDCFSSDDESPNNQQTAANHIKCTSNIKQVMCLLNCILGALGEPAQLPVKLSTEDECKTAWEDTKRCECVWMRQSESFVRKKNFQDYRRKLFVDDEEDCVDGKNLNNGCDSITFNDVSDEENEEDADVFFTPPSSPDFFEMEVDDPDCFNDTLLPEFEIFLTKTSPTKQDAEVYNAVKLAGNELTAEKYPNVYKWFHTVSLYSEIERQSWTNNGLYRSPRTNPKLSTSFTGSPSNLLLKITGVNSPKSRKQVQNGFARSKNASFGT